MVNHVQQPPQQTPTSTTTVGGPAPSLVTNDQASAAAASERRRRSAQAVPNDWRSALGGLLPAEALGAAATVTLHAPPIAELRKSTYALAVAGTAGITEAQGYLTDAGADPTVVTALREVGRNALADRDAFTSLRAQVAQVIAAGDLNTLALNILRTLALTTEDGKIWLHDESKQTPPIVAPLRAHIQATLANPLDDAGRARKASLDALVRAIANPQMASPGAAVTMTPAPLTPAQQTSADALLQRIRTLFPPGRGLAANATPQQVASQRADQQKMHQLLAAVQGAEPRVKEWVYAWRDPQTSQGVLQLLGTYLSPSQVEELLVVLDPLEALVKELVDLRNGQREKTAPPTTEYALMHGFLAGHLGDAATRARFRSNARLMNHFFNMQAADKQAILLRMAVSGREEPDAIDRLHAAADNKDSAAAVTAIYELGATPQRLQDLRTDLVFVHRLQANCNQFTAWNGLQVKPYDLFLRMCGVDPHVQAEAGSVVRQGAVDPTAPAPNAPPATPTPQELQRLDTELYGNRAERLADELNSYWVRDSNVRTVLREFQTKAADPAIVDILRRAHQAPGPELARRAQARGCDVRLKLQRGLSGDFLIEAERILGYATDQAAVGVIGGQGTLATDNRPQNGTGHVPLEQALRETMAGGQVLSPFIHAKAEEIAGELGRFLGARQDHVRSIWNSFKGTVNETVCNDLRGKTGLPRVWAIELLSNAFLQVGGGTLQSKLAGELGREGNGVITEMGLQPTDIAARRTMAEQRVAQSGDEARDHAALDAAKTQAEVAQQQESFRSPAQELFNGLARISRTAPEEALRAIGGKLTTGLAMQHIVASTTVSIAPRPAPTAQHDQSATPGGPVHPGQASPTDFASFYRHEYGIDPRRHAVEVARGLATRERTADQVGTLFGVGGDPQLAGGPVAPAQENQFVVDASNISLVGPGFDIAEAERRAREMWELLHTNGQIQLIRAQIDGRTNEEQRLIHIAFRRLSGGIDLTFFIQQHLAQQQQVENGQAQPGMALAVGGGGAQGTETRSLHVVGQTAETLAMVDVAANGRVTLERRIQTSIAANNMDDVYRAIESASPEERRAILANPDLMNRLRGFGDDAYEWNRIYKGLTGESDLFDRLESRAHGKHGFLGGFESTDEKGMSSDIAAYARQRKAAITREVCGDQPPRTKAQKDEIQARLRAEFQSHAENPAIRSLLQDELSGAELATREGMLINDKPGEENRSASALTEGDITEDEEKILSDIRAMPLAERRRRRADAQYIAQLQRAIQTQATWRDAMIALESENEGGEGDDNFGMLERASRSDRQDNSEFVFERDDVIQALSRLSPSEFQRLTADPRMQAQILTSLEGDPEKLAMARQMMAYNAGNAAQATGLQIAQNGAEADPARNVFSRAQVERIAFLKFSALNRLRAGTSRSWAMTVQASIAIFNMKLKPSDLEEEAAPAGGPAAGPVGAAPPAAAPASAQAPANAPAARAPAPQAAASQPAATQQPAAQASPPSTDPSAAEAAIETRIRNDIWTEAQAEITEKLRAWGNQDDIAPDSQARIVEQAVKHQNDPSNTLLSASTSWITDNEERIKDTIKNASDEQLIRDWTTVTQAPPTGGDSLRDKYERWKAVRRRVGGAPAERPPAAAPTPAAAAPQGNGQASASTGASSAPAAAPSPAPAARVVPVSSPEWAARTAFQTYAIDTSRRFEQQLLRYAGGLFTDNAATADGSRATRDNSEWLEWRTIVREKIPGLDKTKIATAIGATGDSEATGILDDPTLRNTLGQLQYDEERYAVDRGAGSNYNMDRLTAGGQGLGMDNAMGDYRREALTSVTARDPAQYGQITNDEAGRIGEARERFNQSSTDFRAAKSAVAQIAATVVALIITAVVTILTAGTATGPVAVILLGAATAGAASVGANMTTEAIRGTDFDFSNEGLKNIARDTVMGAVAAGTGWYASKLTSALFKAGSAAEQAAILAQTAKQPGFLTSLGRNVTEQTLQTGMQGVIEAGAAPFDPSLWMDGWSEGWRAGGHAVRERAQEIPMEMMRAAVLATMTHSAGHLLGMSGGKSKSEVRAEAQPGTQAGVAGGVNHAALGTRLSLGARTTQIGGMMLDSVGEGLIQGGAELVLDERTWRAEGLKLTELAGTVGASALENMKQAASNVHVSDAQAVMRVRGGARNLALHGHGLTAHERQMYAELAMEGQGTTVISVEHFQDLRKRVVDEAVARHELAAEPLKPSERDAYRRFCTEAPTMEQFHRRVDAGPAATPGLNIPHGPQAKFDTPELRRRELSKAQELLGRLSESREAGNTHHEAATEIAQQRQQMMLEAQRVLASVSTSSPQHAQVVELAGRIEQTMAELKAALATATGTGVLGLHRAELEAKVRAAEASPNDAAKFRELHEAMLAAHAQQITLPGAAERAVPMARAKLAELKAQLAEASSIAEAATRQALNHDPATTTATPAPVVPSTVTGGVTNGPTPVAPAPHVTADPARVATEPAQHADDPARRTDDPARQAADPARRTDDPTTRVTDPAAPHAHTPLDANAAARADLGSSFSGNTHAVDPVRTRRAIDVAMASELPAGARHAGDAVQIPRGTEHVPFEVRVQISDAPAHEFAPVATVRFDGGDHAVIVVSPGASEAAVQRAVAGKLAELAHVVDQRSRGTRADTTSALTEGSQAHALSPADYNQIAQVKTALHQIEAAQRAGDQTGAEAMRRDAYALIVGMGLLEQAPAQAPHPAPGHGDAHRRIVGPEAATARLDLVTRELGGDAAKLRELVHGAHQNAAAIGDIRTQRAAARERLRAWCEQQIAARKEANVALQGQVDAAIGADGTGKVFDRIIVGGGWAATADYGSLGVHEAGGVPGTIAISRGGDPWSGRGDLLMGQNPAELEVRGFAVQPGDLAADPHQFTSSKDFSTAVGASAAASGMPTYDGMVTKVEQRPATDAAGWPAGANWKITANGKTFYAARADIVSGPGPARTPPAGNRINDPSGYAVDSHGGHYYRYTPGVAGNDYHVVEPHLVPDQVRAKLDAQRGFVSEVFVDHETKITVDTSTSPETYRNHDGTVIPASAVPHDVAKRLGMNPGGRQEGPALVDQQGRLNSSRVFDPASRHSVDLVTSKVYGPDGHIVDSSVLPADVKARLGIQPDGKIRDPRFVAAGNGMSVNPVTGHVIDTATGAPVDVTKLDAASRTALEQKIAQHRVGFGGERLAGEYAPGTDGHTPNVLIYGAGASGAWDVEQAAAGGANVDWAGRLQLPSPTKFPEGSRQREAFTQLHDPATSPADRQRLLTEMHDEIVKESFKEGFNRRNSMPGIGAHSPEVLGRIDQNPRSIVDIQPTNDGRFYVRFSDGTDHVYDKVTMSIGQNAQGEGGVGDLTSGIPIKELRGSGGDVAGAQDSTGTLRILGAAGASGPIVNRLPDPVRGEIRNQAQHLPQDSRGIAPSIRNNAGRIGSVNEPDLHGSRRLTDVEHAKLEQLVSEHGLVQGERLFNEWKATNDPNRTATGGSEGTQVGTPSNEADHRVADNSPQVTSRAKATVDAMDPSTRQRFDELAARAENSGQRTLIDRALAAGHSVDDVHRLVAAMSGMSAADAIREFSGAGIVQFFQQSCVPASYQIALAEVDPLYALKLRNNPEMVMQQQRDALREGGGMATQRDDVRRGKDVPPAMQEHLDDPRAKAVLDDPKNRSTNGSLYGIEATEMHDRELHKQLEAVTGQHYDIVTTDQLQYKKGGDGQFAGGAVPHDRIAAAVDAGHPVIFGMRGHAQVIVGRTVDNTGAVTYLISDPMSGTTSRIPAHLLDLLGVQSLTLPSGGATPTTQLKPHPTTDTPTQDSNATKTGGGADDKAQLAGTPLPKDGALRPGSTSTELNDNDLQSVAQLKALLRQLDTAKHPFGDDAPNPQVVKQLNLDITALLDSLGVTGMEAPRIELIEKVLTARQREQLNDRHREPPAKAKRVSEDANKDGVSDRSRVGVAGMEIPDKIPRLENLPPEQAAAQKRFAEAYESPGGKEALAKEYMDGVVADKTIDGKPKNAEEMKTFGTDNAKDLSPDYNLPDGPGVTAEQRNAAKGLMNLAVHQTANAVAKLAFIMRLDQIAQSEGGGTIMITAGGVAAGKGHAIKNNEIARGMVDRAKVIWDTAGEQNSTELPWVIAEAKKRGLTVEILYVHQRPENSWPRVVSRAQKEGRMVDARLHAESYAEGARNFDAVQKAHPDVKTVIVDVSAKDPVQIENLPKDALTLDANDVHQKNVEHLKKQEGLAESIKAGGHEQGEKVWGPPEQRAALAELGSIEISTLPAGAVVKGHDNVPLDRNTYFVSQADGKRMLELMLKLGPDVETRAYKKGFIIRRTTDGKLHEWYFELNDSASRAGAKKVDGPRGDGGLPPPNAATIELWGFSGVRKINGRGKDQWTPEEAAQVKRARDQEPLLFAGHIGISLDGGKTIIGFTPKPPEGMTMAEFLKSLMDHDAFPGVLGDDTHIFIKAAEAARERGWDTEPIAAVQLVDEPKKMEVVDSAAKISGMKPGEHGFGYSFPKRPEERTGADDLFAGSNGFEANCVRNCGAFPEKLGVAIPEPSGNVKLYMPELEKWANEDGPKDFRDKSVDKPKETK